MPVPLGVLRCPLACSCAPRHAAAPGESRQQHGNASEEEIVPLPPGATLIELLQLIVHSSGRWDRPLQRTHGEAVVKEKGRAEGKDASGRLQKTQQSIFVPKASCGKERVWQSRRAGVSQSRSLPFSSWKTTHEVIGEGDSSDARARRGWEEGRSALFFLSPPHAALAAAADVPLGVVNRARVRRRV